MEKNIVLPETSLCAIVRDELKNPAGGIERFVKTHILHLEEAIIVDTGSIDGTKEVLEGLANKYPNLKVYDYKFDGFADARNYALSKVRTKYSLVLDADEIITIRNPSNEWEKISNVLQEFPKKESFNFNIIDISQSHYKNTRSFWGQRLFLTKGAKFVGKFCENLNYSFNYYFSGGKIGTIFHFLSEGGGIIVKNKEYYSRIKENVIGNIPLSKIEGFSSWKAYNPQRDQYE